MTARDTFDLTLTRTIRAPRQRVFDAFVDPDLLRLWFAPRGFSVMGATVDARVGGRYRMEAGWIEVDRIRRIEMADITPALARKSGFDGVVDLLKIAKHGRGENVYLVEFHYEE